MKKWAIVGGVVAVVAIVAVVLMSRGGPPPEPPKVERAAGPDPARVAKVAELLKRISDLENRGQFADALRTLRELAVLEPGEPGLATLKPRLEEKLRRFEAWKKAHERAESAHKDAARRDTPADWQKVLDLCLEAEKDAPAEEPQRLTRELAATARQRRDWASAREEEKKGNLAGALDLVAKAIAAREAPPELAAYKTALERKKRKGEFDRAASAARAEVQAARAIELWRAARALADDAKDAEEAEQRIYALLPRVDPAERDRRYEAAMKAGEAALADGKIEEADKSFKEAQSLKVADLKAGQGITRVEAARKRKGYEAALSSAREAEGKRDWDGAIEAYERALRLKSGDSAASARRRELEETYRPARITVVIDEPTGLKMDFVRIKRGRFRMGDAQGDSDEAPHDVAIEKDFWMQATEVTQAQWGLLMKSKPWNFSSTPDLPVEGVSWVEVQKFLEKLAAIGREQLGGRTPTLPTEAEWEYACRAGTTSRWLSGADDADLDRHGWFTRNAGRSPQPVARKQANPWGLFDMHGNVAEWCLDWYARDPLKAPDPANLEGGQHRVIRGGNWNDRAVNCRSAKRERELPAKGSMFVGFRVVLR